VRRLGQVSTAMASGWMALGAMRRRAGIRDGFVLSDHADWKGLNEVVQACQPERVFTMHGYQDAFARWLRETGADAATVEVLRETGHHNQAGTVPGPSDLSSNATLQ